MSNRQKEEVFTVGEPVFFNRLGRDAKVNLPAPNGIPWVVQNISDNPNKNAPHSKLIDLGDGYPIGPVSGMFLTHSEEK